MKRMEVFWWVDELNSLRVNEFKGLRVTFSSNLSIFLIDYFKNFLYQSTSLRIKPSKLSGVITSKE